MARYCGAVCRFCRREGEKLFLKGERCFTNKCAIERREGGPGQHGKARQSHSDFKVQLREKQKTKRIYGMLETGFRAAYERAATTKGVTGSQLLIACERRLDNVALRLGFATSRRQARQLVSHGQLLVNGRCIALPGYEVQAGDIVEIVEGRKKHPGIVAAMDFASSRVIPEWLSLDKAMAKGTVISLPTREAITQSLNEQLIVEHYSR
jgi:small subunit ribosomal protein S4